MPANYHTHTRRCQHAAGSDEAYVRSAMRNGFEELGFSDHVCWKYDSNYHPTMRMELRDFPGYKKSVRALQKKYAGKISLLLGMEAEYFPRYMDWLLDFAVEQELDYLILGNHFKGSDEYGGYYGYISLAGLKDYVDDAIAGMKTGMYSYLAHPDLPMRSPYLSWNEEVAAEFQRLIEAAKELDIPLEYNGLGLQETLRTGHYGYPHPEFWKLAAANGNKAIIGMDAHHPDDLDHEIYDLARRRLEKLGMEIVEELPRVDFKALQKARQKTK